MSNLSAALAAMDKATPICGKLTDLELSLVDAISLYYPYSRKEIRTIYAKCGKSFDKTIKAIELGTAYNDMERGIREATKDDALAWIKEALPWLCELRNQVMFEARHTDEDVAALDAMIARAKPEEVGR